MKNKIKSIIGVGIFLATMAVFYIVREAFRYQYFVTKELQYRTDRYTKETDLLSQHGWIVIQIDRPTDKIQDPLFSTIVWEHDGLFVQTNNRVCINIRNPSGQILSDVLIRVHINEDSVIFVKDKSEEYVIASPNHLLMPDEVAEACGPVKVLILPPDNKWSADFFGASGWLR